MDRVIGRAVFQSAADCDEGNLRAGFEIEVKAARSCHLR